MAEFPAAAGILGFSAGLRPQESKKLYVSGVNLSMNKTMQILAVFTILLTVPMVVTGAYGMNVDLPLQEDHYAFDVIFWFTLVVVSSLLIWFRKKHIV